jgi:hypothetical protein
MAQTEGYSSIPEERNENEVDGQQGREAKDSFFKKIRKWWSNVSRSTSETAPLLNRRTMTLEPPKPSPLKTILLIAGSFIVIVVFLIAIISSADSAGK